MIPLRGFVFLVFVFYIYPLIVFGLLPSPTSDRVLEGLKQNSLRSERHPDSSSFLLKSNHTFGFLTYPSGPRSVLLVNGTTDDSFIFSFQLEPGSLASNYSLVFLSNDTHSLDPRTDVSFSQTEYADVINSTVALDFHRFPGRVQLTVEIRYTTDASIYDVFKVDYLIAGIAIYIKRTLTIISGAGRSFIIPSYKDIHTSPHWEFSVFVQYPNGSDSSTWPITSNEMFVPSVGFDSILPEIMFQYGQIRWDDSVCAIDGGKWEENQLILKSGCGMGFGNAFINDTKFDGCRFALDFQLYRVGKLGILFTWNGFTLGSELEDEELTNYIIIEILGQPPSIVRRIEPANPFDKNGGEELYVETINTADVNMTSFNVNDEPFSLIEGSRSIVNGPEDYYESAKFLTKSGTGKRLPWSITATRTVNETETLVKFIDETGFLFSYNDEGVTLHNMIPSSAPEEGEAIVALIGDFPSFNTSDLTHNVFCGNMPIDRFRYLFFNDSLIKFNVPKRTDIGASWKYSIYIQIGDSFSNELTFEYTPSSLLLRGIIFGASFNDDQGVYILNHCGNTTFMVIVTDQQETENARYTWKLLDRSNLDYLLLDNATSVAKNAATLELPNAYIPRFGETFYIVAIVSGRNATGTYIFSVRKSDGFVIGVTLIQPENRTISTPSVNVRIIAKIEFPECADIPTELIYEWELENKSQTMETALHLGLTPLSVHEASLPPSYDKYVFSFQNDTGTRDDEITPTRLGRELIVPRELIEQGLHRVRLTVRDNIVPLRGFDSTNFTILESSLVAVIGTGQISRRISDAESLIMTCEHSYDPDVITSSNRSIGLSYLWSCDFSLFSNFSNMTPCENALLSPEAVNLPRFEVTTKSLKAFSNLTIEGEHGSVYLRYSVTVTKQARKSIALQDLSLTRAMGETVSRYQRIEVVNSRNEAVMLDAVEFWDEVVIRPIAPTSTEWRFRLELPVSERARFLTSGNLIASAGYYTIPGQSAPGFQQLPLGIKADRFRPRQTYQFLITFQEAGRLADDVAVRFKTAEVPDLSFPPLTNPNGSTATIFRATASTSFQGHAKFTYQFYLYDTSKNSSEYCIDGCTGAHTVRFQIPSVGTYVLQCRLLSASGKTLLSVKNNTKSITVFSLLSSNLLSDYDTSILRDFKLGDDGWVTQSGFFAAESIHEHDQGSKGMIETRSSTTCTSFTQKWVQILRHIVSNELPNTPNARNYVGLAANYARLDCVGYEDILYDLLTVVDRSIMKTPQEEVLTTSSYSQAANFPNVEMHENLRRFYNFSITKAIQIITQGSTRSRLMPRPGEVNNLILDLSELSMKHLTATATSGRVCGWEGKYTFGTWDGVSSQSITPSELGSPLGITSVHVAVKCNSEQGRSLKTPHASFEWCDAVFAVSGDDRKLIVLAETFDFPHISGIQGENSSETVRIVMVDITTLGKNNQLESTVSTENVMKAQASKTGANANTCYRIGMQMSPNTAARTMNCWLNQPFLMSPRKPFGWKISEPFEENMYLQRTTGLSTTAETRNSTINVTAQSNELGLYGAHRATCSVSPENLVPSDGTSYLLAGFLIGILLLIIIVTALTYLLMSTLIGAGARSDEDDDGMAATAHYVERDYFGRKEVRLDMGSYTSSAASSMFFDGSQRLLMLSGALPMAEKNSYGSDKIMTNNMQVNGEHMFGSGRATRP